MLLDIKQAILFFPPLASKMTGTLSQVERLSQILMLYEPLG